MAKCLFPGQSLDFTITVGSDLIPLGSLSPCTQRGTAILGGTLRAMPTGQLAPPGTNEEGVTLQICFRAPGLRRALRGPATGGHHGSQSHQRTLMGQQTPFCGGHQGSGSGQGVPFITQDTEAFAPTQWLWR